MAPNENEIGTSDLELISRREEEFWALKGKLSAGRMTQAEFYAAVAMLVVQDHRGQVWRIEPEEGVWLLFKNNQWVRDNPRSSESDIREPALESAPESTVPDESALTAQRTRVTEVSVTQAEEQTAGGPRARPEESKTPPPSEPQHAASGMERCRECGAFLSKTKKFCTKCGAQIHATEPPSPPGQTAVESSPDVFLTFDSAPLSPPTSGGERFVFGGARRESPPSHRQPEPKKVDSREPEPTPSLSRSKPRRSAELEQPLPPAPQPWGFQDKMTEVADKVIAFLQQSGLSARTGLGGILPRMVRATLLDNAVYREVASDPSLQAEAWQVLILVVVLSSSGVLIASLQSLSASMLFSIVPAAVIQAVALLARIWVTRLVASSWLKTPIGFNPFFRALVYAQSPVCLQVVPVVGQFIGLWRMITSTAAIRDITGCSTQNAAILAVVGTLGDMMAISFAGPFIQTLIAKL
jgi:hypothetical protein